MGPPSPAEAHGVAPLSSPRGGTRRRTLGWRGFCRVGRGVRPRRDGRRGHPHPRVPSQEAGLHLLRRWQRRIEHQSVVFLRFSRSARLYVRFGHFLHQRGQVTTGAAALLPAAQVPSPTTSAHHSRYSFPPLSPSFSAKLSTQPRTLSRSDLITSLSVCMWLRALGSGHPSIHATMLRRKTREPKEENITLGPTVREGEFVFGVAHIFASFNDTFISSAVQSGKKIMQYGNSLDSGESNCLITRLLARTFWTWKTSYAKDLQPTSSQTIEGCN
ncbi:uncharacterized protein [Miscanthus floridulus]|uniref:uncharacterized protein isoform X1 n=2 Tax=Miscanthus floridulus TaxID=154761 RepID=UPI0034591A4A